MVSRPVCICTGHEFKLDKNAALREVCIMQVCILQLSTSNAMRQVCIMQVCITQLSTSNAKKKARALFAMEWIGKNPFHSPLRTTGRSGLARRDKPLLKSSLARFRYFGGNSFTAFSIRVQNLKFPSAKQSAVCALRGATAGKGQGCYFLINRFVWLLTGR